jgi:hypothetical protein
MTYVTAYAPGPHSYISGEMYQAVASDFQIQVNTVYMCVYGDVFQSEEDLVEAFNAIPNAEHNSTLAIAIMQMRLKTPTGPSATGNPTKTPKKRKQKPEPKTATAAATSPSPNTNPATPLKGPVCCFYLSASGCQKSDCTRAHRLPTANEQKNNVKNFFDKSKLVQKLF